MIGLSPRSVYLEADGYAYLLRGEACVAVKHYRGTWITVAGDYAIALFAIARELQKARSAAHKCIWCGSGVGIFGEWRICPACSND